MVSITLYQFEECPYCEKVRQKLRELGLNYDKVNVPRDREAPLRKELQEKSGVPTVPVIRINDRYLGESAEIIRHLEQNF